MSAVLAIVAARPGYLNHYAASPLIYSAPLVHQQEYVKYEQPIVTKVGAVVQSIPTAVSHQSQSVVHSQAHVVQPILAHGVKTYVTPVVKTYAAAPVYKSYAAPLLYHSYAAPSVYGSYGHGHGLYNSW